MAQQKFKEFLKTINDSSDIIEWAADKSWVDGYTNCHRGDWLSWLYAKTNPDDLKGFILANGLCANEVRHLMHDKRSIKAIDAAIAFGRGEISIDELNDASYNAANAYASAPFDPKHRAALCAAYAAAYASNTALDNPFFGYINGVCATIIAAAYAANANANASHVDASASYNTEREKYRNKTADIIREILPIEKWNIELTQ